MNENHYISLRLHLEKKGRKRERKGSDLFILHFESIFKVYIKMATFEESWDLSSYAKVRVENRNDKIVVILSKKQYRQNFSADAILHAEEFDRLYRLKDELQKAYEDISASIRCSFEELPHWAATIGDKYACFMDAYQILNSEDVTLTFALRQYFNQRPYKEAYENAQIAPPGAKTTYGGMNHPLIYNERTSTKDEASGTKSSTASGGIYHRRGITPYPLPHQFYQPKSSSSSSKTQDQGDENAKGKKMPYIPPGIETIDGNFILPIKNKGVNFNSGEFTSLLSFFDEIYECCSHFVNAIPVYVLTCIDTVTSVHKYVDKFWDERDTDNSKTIRITLIRPNFPEGKGGEEMVRNKDRERILTMDDGTRILAE